MTTQEKVDALILGAFDKYRKALGLATDDPMSEKALECFREAMHQHAKQEILAFGDYLNKNHFNDDVRFDFFMVNFYQEKERRDIYAKYFTQQTQPLNT